MATTAVQWDTFGIEIPDVRYARSGAVAIAYQVVGRRPVDLVWVPFLWNLGCDSDDARACAGVPPTPGTGIGRGRTELGIRIASP